MGNRLTAALARLLVVGAICWPSLLGVAAWARHSGRAPLFASAVYAAASRVCHQRPDRSFFTAGIQWPVCGRCSGLYLAAPFGAVWALRRRSDSADLRARSILAVASLPTIVTLLLEWPAIASPTNLVRAAAAVPLGLATAWVLVRQATMSGVESPDRPRKKSSSGVVA
jgi:uncharacterized membrane protein